MCGIDARKASFEYPYLSLARWNDGKDKSDVMSILQSSGAYLSTIIRSWIIGFHGPCMKVQKQAENSSKNSFCLMSDTWDPPDNGYHRQCHLHLHFLLLHLYSLWYKLRTQLIECDCDTILDDIVAPIFPAHLAKASFLASTFKASWHDSTITCITLWW